MSTFNDGVRDSDMERIQSKMDAYVNELTGTADGLIKTARVSGPNSYQYTSYKSSFLTMGDMQIPDDYREIFKWCRYFFKFDSLVGPAVRSLATFPITEYIVNESKEGERTTEDNEDSDTYRFYKNMLDEINLYKHLIEVGYNYHLYGNLIVFAEPGVKEYKYRDETGEIQSRKEVTWKSINILDPSLITKDKDPLTNQNVYYYHLPHDIKRVIKSKKPREKYDRIPKIYKEAVRKNVPLKLNSEFIYDMSMPTESGDNGLWATPPILHAMKLIMYTNVLRQAQEAIAHEHIVPKRIYYFQPTEENQAIDNFEQITADFSAQLNRQLRDPNYQLISPIPISEITHGGQGRNLLLVPEIEQLQNSILAAMNVPKEFVFGGMSYSGSTTSLRILENNFITYRSLLNEYVNDFLIKKLAKLRGEWEVADDDDKLVTVEFSELKMQDDIQQKELMVRLNQAEKIPDEVLYEKVFGLKSDTVKEQLKNEKREALEQEAELMMMQQEMQMKMQEMGMDPSGGEGEEAPEQGGQGEQGEQGEEAPEQEETPEEPQEEGEEEAPEEGEHEQKGLAPLNGKIPTSMYTGPNSLNAEGMFLLATQLVNEQEDEVTRILNELDYSTKVHVRTYINYIKDQNEMETDMRPAPEKLPPRREGGV